jgi:hypothetical protein
VTKKGLFDSLRDFFAGSPPTPERAVDDVPNDIWQSPESRRREEKLMAEWRERLPTSSWERVVLIRDQIGELERAAAARKMQVELDELGRIKATHLPTLLKSYVEIPAEHRAEVFRETGKSASFLLNDSLDKLLARLREIGSQLAKGNINKFAENIRFVDLYYDQSKDPFGPV